jgi:ankyrin repeat protein
MAYLLLDDFEQSLYSQSAHEESPVSDGDSPSGQGSIEEFWDSMNLGDDTLFNDPVELEADACARIAQQYALFDYAARYWPRHFLLACPKYLPALQNSALVLSDTMRFYGLNWFRYYWLQSEINLSRPENFCPMVTASYFGHMTSLKAVLLGGVPIEMDIGRRSIYWASRMGHHAIVDLLLGQGVNPDIEVIDGHTCLTAAVQFSHVNVVSRLLEDEGLISGQDCYRVNYAARGGRTPLSIAAGNGLVDIVRRLLEHPRIQPDIEDASKWTPLFWSISGKHLDVLQLLLMDKNISVNHVDKSGRNVLSWAASEGEHEMVKYLMSLSHLEAQERDRKGRTALSWAAGSGHLQTTAYLRRRIDVSTKDNDGRNALSWACSGCHASVVEYLIKHDPKGVDEADTVGWTPLAWALFENCPKVVQLLLHSGLVDVNKKDHGGRTALAWAASYGYIDVVQLLLNTKGVDVDSTVISCARQHAHILRLMQEYVQ